MTPDDTSKPLIELRGVTKAYGPTIANDDVSFAVRAGSVHALLGENGAGKSTTMKLLSGLIQPDRGEILLDGEPLALGSARAAHAAGIQTAFQELTLIPDLTVLDNMMLPRGSVGPLGVLRRRSSRQEIRAFLDGLDLRVDLGALACELDLATRQKVEIARALYRNPRILLLDEPTSALSGGDVQWLGDIIAKAKARGVTVLFISHRMPEVRAFCDHMTILRNGKHIRSGAVESFTDAEVVELIIGRSVENTFPAKPDAAAVEARDPVLEVRGLSAGPKLRDVSFVLRPGEILGVAGLQGMGQNSLFSALFGEERLKSGEILVDGAPVHLASPADALHPSVAIGLVPEERKTQGLFLQLNGRLNASLPVIGRFHRGPLIDAARESRATAEAFDVVEVEERAQYMAAGAFSGGNQQKISIAKWLVAQSRILLLFDPTRGIDVGTKHQLYDMMRAFTAAGGAILLHSTEIPELEFLSDRVAVLYEGRVDRWLEGDAITEVAMMEAALGGASLTTGAA
ncbi:sugar ABC transporter ATP-binding protein [Vannielia sp. SX4]|uniref:sugar ABC transporter ATP-binding protein n=1 Tax=Vannielia sp. SX4 TaxID=3463852 RepID=UPI004059CA88